MAVKRQRLCSRIKLCKLQRREENVLVDELTCVGPGRGYKTPVWTGKPVWAMSVKRKGPCGRVGLCGPRQKLECVCVDKKACVGYVSEKKMSIWTSWPV